MKSRRVVGRQVEWETWRSPAERAPRPGQPLFRHDAVLEWKLDGRLRMGGVNRLRADSNNGAAAAACREAIPWNFANRLRDKFLFTTVENRVSFCTRECKSAG